MVIGLFKQLEVTHEEDMNIFSQKFGNSQAWILS